MTQDNEPTQENTANKTSKFLTWGKAGCGCLGFGVVLIGILSAIALPSFINQANRAKQSKAKFYVSSLNVAQQGYFLENQTLANSIEATGLGISEEMESYTYRIEFDDTQPYVAVNLATPTRGNLKGYAGFVFLTPLDDTNFYIQTLLCETESPVATETPMPSTLPTALRQCPAGFVERSPG